MKDASNTKCGDPPYNLVVTNKLTVPTIDSTTINTGTISANRVNTEELYIGPNLFYSQGSFTPQLKSLETVGTGTLALTSFNSPSGISGNGYYIKNGNSVTIWYDCQVTFGGFQNDFLYSVRYPVVTGLPFKCLMSGVGIDLEFGGPTTISNYPDGKVGGAPAPLGITFNDPYTSLLLEEGRTYIPRIPPAYVTPASSWVADGYTIIIECNQAQYTIDPLTIPPTFPEVWNLPGTAYNFNVLVGGTYNCRFAGNFTYFTE